MKKNELVIKRTFNAPVATVWKAWTDPEYLKQWSCPRDFKGTFAKGDLRPGGAWSYGMLSDKTGELTMHGEYREVAEHKKLVFTHAWRGPDGKPGHETLIAVEFEDQGGKTLMTFTQTGFESTESRDSHNDGWSQCFDKLAELLEKR